MKHVDNRSGIVPSSAPKIPTLNTAQVPPRPTKLKRQLQSPLKNLVTCHHQFHQWHLQSVASATTTYDSKRTPQKCHQRDLKVLTYKNSSQNSNIAQEPSSKPPPLPSGPPPVPTSAPLCQTASHHHRHQHHQHQQCQKKNRNEGKVPTAPHFHQEGCHFI